MPEERDMDLMLTMISPKPGDVIVACSDEELEIEVGRGIVTMLRDKFPNNECLVLGPHIRIEAVRDPKFREKLSKDWQAKEADDGEGKAEGERARDEAQGPDVQQEQGAESGE